MAVYLHLWFISTVYFGFTELSMDWSKGEVFLTLLYFMTAVGIVQMLIKSYISTYLHEHYMKLIAWMKSQYTEVKVQGLMREIVERNLHAAFKQSRMIILMYIGVFGMAPLGYMATVILRQGLHAVIIIPFISYDHPSAKLIYYSVEFPYTLLAGILSGVGDSTTIIAGIHIMKAVDTINDLIRLLDDKDKANQCPNILIVIYKKHSEIIKMLSTLNEIMYLISLIQLFTSTFMFLVLFTSARTQPMEMVFYLFQLCVISQLFLLCAFGEVIFSKTQVIFTQLYLTKWYDMSLSNQKAILMMMRMSEAPYGLKAGGMFDINMYTFIQIVKMAISYCAIIITLA
ncbi:odorant receptor 85b-like [Phlebotomus argentipes]|uniref:odorant receptor 85b-like n=1 Tax=Phlebotomus argentipes TaxID=94469 RepID=UPI00289327C7|nr:odorant receptor 85b-like [Phlebotomus argentipes]